MTRRKWYSDRRKFLRASGALAAAGMTGLAGCLGDDDDDTDDVGDPADDDDDVGDDDDTDDTDDTDDNDLEDELAIFQWGDYWPDDFVSNFEDAYGVDVTVSNYASNEEMFSTLQAGGTGQYDLIFPSDYMVTILHDQGMIQPLDMDRLPNWGNLMGTFEEAPYDPGEERYSAPYQWGTSGIAWHDEMLGEDVEISSWSAMWNEEWAGQMTMLNDMRETIGAALKYLGYSLNTTDEAAIHEARDILIDQKDLLATYDSSNFSTNLINQERSPVHGWSGGIFAAYWETWEEDAGSPINYVIPEEGSVVWVDTAAITDEAASPNAAHAFINHFLEAEVGAEITNYTYYGSPNAAAEEFIFAEILEDERIYPSEETMANLEFIEDVGQATQLYDEAWTEIQAA